MIHNIIKKLSSWLKINKNKEWKYNMYNTIKFLPDWLKIVKNKVWKYNFIGKNWKLLSKHWFDNFFIFSKKLILVYIEWKWYNFINKEWNLLSKI